MRKKYLEELAQSLRKAESSVLSPAKHMDRKRTIRNQTKRIDVYKEKFFRTSQKNSTGSCVQLTSHIFLTCDHVVEETGLVKRIEGSKLHIFHSDTIYDLSLAFSKKPFEYKQIYFADAISPFETIDTYATKDDRKSSRGKVISISLEPVSRTMHLNKTSLYDKLSKNQKLNGALAIATYDSSPGYSGGSTINSQGQLIGIHQGNFPKGHPLYSQLLFSQLKDQPLASFITIDYVKSFLKEYLKSRKITF